MSEPKDVRILRLIRRMVDGPNHHHRDELISKYGRWGTCVDCPRDDNGFPLTDQCKHTDRYDHKLQDPALSFILGLETTFAGIYRRHGDIDWEKEFPSDD